MGLFDKIPKKVRGDKPMKDMTPAELEAQNKRIDNYLTEKAAEETAKKFENGS